MAQSVNTYIRDYRIYITRHPASEGYTALADNPEGGISVQGETPAKAMTGLIFALNLLDNDGATAQAEQRIKALEAENSQLRDQLDAKYIHVRDLTTLRIVQTLVSQLGSRGDAIGDTLSEWIAELEGLMDVEEEE